MTRERDFAMRGAQHIRSDLERKTGPWADGGAERRAGAPHPQSPEESVARLLLKRRAFSHGFSCCERRQRPLKETGVNVPVAR